MRRRLRRACGGWCARREGSRVTAGQTADIEALEANEAFFRTLVDVAPIPLWRAGPDGGCTYVNRAWRELTGRELEDSLADGWGSGVHPEDFDTLRGAAAAALEKREAVDLEYRLRRHDGAWRWLNDRRRPLFADGQFTGVLGCCLDFTDLRDKDAECRQALSERDKLLAELHHRVRNNAQTITSLLSLQASRATDRRVLTALRAAGLRVQLATLVQDRLILAGDLAGVELGGVAEAAARAAVTAAANPLLRLEVDRALEVRLPAARVQSLALAVGELAANAAVHAYRYPAGGRIGLRLHRDGSEVTLAVEDAGGGLRARRRGRTPTGQLGLHLAERLARQAQATLTLEVGAGENVAGASGAGQRGVGTRAVLRWAG